MKTNRPNDSESKFEKVISYLLTAGVLISILLEITGVVLYYQDYRNLSISRDSAAYINGHDFFSFIYQQFQNFQTTKPAIIFMIMGIVVLILTPYIRVIASFIYFCWRKNYKYVLFTLFVLVVVTISLALH
jgi:uncharacterized membrane protein